MEGSQTLAVCCVRETKKEKEKTCGDNFTHIPRHPFLGGHQLWRVMSHDVIKYCCIVTESIQGFRSPMWPNIAILH